MTDKDNWRWDDLDSVFDDDFVEKAEFKEDDWKARKEAQQQRKKDEAKEAKRKSRPARPPRPGAPEPQPKAPLTREQKLKRAGIIAGIVVLLLIGLGLDGHLPGGFLQRNADPTTTSSTVTTATTQAPAQSTPSTSPTQGSAPQGGGGATPSSAGNATNGSASSPTSAGP